MTQDTRKVEAFQQKLAALYNSAAVGFMVSIGHRTRLFDVLAESGPLASKELALKAGLVERYVREWLGAMTTGGVLTYDAASKRYTLPAEHAASLTRAATPGNMAVVAQFLSVLGGVEDKIVECFKKGGGVPYSEYPRFHEVMAEESGQTIVAALEEHILPLVPGLPQKLERGIDVVDIGCGSGLAMIKLAKLFPNSRFRGYDLSEQAVGRANQEAKARGLRNVQFAVRDVTRIGETEQYDLITAFDAIHDQIHPAAVLKEISAALRPGGFFLMQDIRGSSHVEQNLDNPLAPFFYTISCMHCMTVSLSAGGDGLGAMWGKELALKMLAEAGLPEVEVRELAHDVQNYYYIARKA